jgi:hypothetical protein
VCIDVLYGDVVCRGDILSSRRVVCAPVTVLYGMKQVAEACKFIRGSTFH